MAKHAAISIPFHIRSQVKDLSKMNQPWWTLRAFMQQTQITNEKAALFWLNRLIEEGLAEIVNPRGTFTVYRFQEIPKTSRHV